jgi:TatD DNase family protein
MWTDDHCHLPAELGEATAVVEQARAAGVTRIITIGTTLADSTSAIAVARALDGVWATVGLHPHDAKDGLGGFEPLLSEPEVVGVGECGLDYHYDHSPRDVQRQVFARLVGLAREVGKPIVVHTRQAPADTISILEAERARDVGGVIHCFSEDMPFATRALDLGFYLSFSGIVTFRSAQSVHEVARAAPLERILVETDSPYLAPVPLRGKPCEPAYVVHTARRVAELRNMSPEALADATSINAERAFRRAFGAPADP